MRVDAFTRTHMPAAPRAALTLLLIFTICIPSTLFYIGLASSTAMGSMVVSGIALMLCFTLQKVSRRRTAQAALFLTLFVMGIALHLLVASIFSSVNLFRGIASLLPLCICIAGGWAIAAIFAQARSVDLTRAVKRSLALLGVIASLGIVGWLQPASMNQYGKPVFPFPEPSHLALILAPLLIFTCVSSKSWQRPLYLAAAFLVTAALENLTMGAVFILAALICLKSRQILLLSLLLVPAIATLDLSYYLERLVFNVDSQNLSSLVYLQGWQMLGESFERTYGFGLGFQQLGVFGTNVSASDKINLLMGVSLNLFDGGFNMVKLLSELGVFGALLLCVYIRYLVQAIRLLRRVAHYGERQPAELLFSASCIVGYLVELLLRGIGYFTPTGILLVFSLLIWRRFERHPQKYTLTPVPHINKFPSNPKL